MRRRRTRLLLWRLLPLGLPRAGVGMILRASQLLKFLGASRGSRRQQGRAPVSSNHRGSRLKKQPVGEAAPSHAQFGLFFGFFWGFFLNILGVFWCLTAKKTIHPFLALGTFSSSAKSSSARLFGRRSSAASGAPTFFRGAPKWGLGPLCPPLFPPVHPLQLPRAAASIPGAEG